MRVALLSLSLLALLVLAVPAGATTFQMVSDRSLADEATAVVAARVVGVEPAPVQGRPSTDYLVEVDRVLKGNLPGSTVVVRVPGGVGPDGIGLKVWGAPEFAEGERALLFLNPAQDGTYRVLHLMLGAFHLRHLRGRSVAMRDFSEAHEAGPWGVREGGVDVPRDLEAFSSWLEDRSYGVEREGDYLVDSQSGELGVAPQPFGLLDSERGYNIRWFRFDQGNTVAWRVHSGGQPGLTLAATIDAFRTALAAWTDDPATNIRYSYAGTTGASGGLADSDNVNTILFDDPYRDDPTEAIEGTFTCSKGGVIAMGGPYFFFSTRTFKGKEFHEAAEADIVTNNGTECLFRDNPKVAEEVFAHELGHTLGLGHSQNREALMYANAANDGRGARLSADDRDGISYLYGDGSGPGNPPPVSGPQSLVTPARLRARATSPTQVSLTWRDKSKGEDGYRVEVKAPGGRFQEILTLPADSTSATISGLRPRTAYVFRVRSAGSKGFSPYATVRITTPKRR